MSTLVLLNHCLDFNETLHEHLVPSLVVHIVRNFDRTFFGGVMGLCCFFHYITYKEKNFVYACSPKPLLGFQ